MSEGLYMPPVEVATVREGARLPERAYEGDACFDVYAAERRTITPGWPVSVPTGLAMAVPEGFVGLLKPRSGLALRHGVQVLGGVIDPGYRGEIMVLMLAAQPVALEAGCAVAQVHFTTALHPEFSVVSELDDGTERGGRGFGSSDS